MVTKVKIVVLMAVLLIVFFYFFQPTGKIVSNQKEVKVGAILALTGQFEIFGDSFQKGIDIAVDELNKKGDIKYKIIYEDDGDFDIKKAVETGRKLINLDSIDVSFINAANDGKSVSTIFESEKTPLIVLFDSNKDLEKGDYTFSMGFSTEGAAKTMSEFAYTKLGSRKISVVYSFDDWSQLLATSFKKYFEEIGGKVPIFEGTDFDEDDFRTLILKSKDSDAIYFPTVLPSYIIKQARELGYKGYLLSADGLNQDQIDASQGSADGVYYTNVYLPENKKFQKLIEMHKIKYGKEPDISALTAIAYDAMYAIDEAVRKNDIGREQIKKGLYEISFEGATGKIDFEQTGMSPRFESIFVVKNGKGEIYGKE